MAQPLRLASLLLTMAIWGTADGAERVALLIGNAAYPDAPLRNPRNDVRAMSGRLRALGFDVLALEEATKRDMEKRKTPRVHSPVKRFRDSRSMDSLT